jgi:hypothetical protein
VSEDVLTKVIAARQRDRTIFWIFIAFPLASALTIVLILYARESSLKKQIATTVPVLMPQTIDNLTMSILPPAAAEASAPATEKPYWLQARNKSDHELANGAPPPEEVYLVSEARPTVKRVKLSSGDAWVIRFTPLPKGRTP